MDATRPPTGPCRTCGCVSHTCLGDCDCCPEHAGRSDPPACRCGDDWWDGGHNDDCNAAPDRVSVADVMDRPLLNLPPWVVGAHQDGVWRREGGVMSVRVAPGHWTVAYDHDWLIRDGGGVRLERGTRPSESHADAPGRVGVGERTPDTAQDDTGPLDTLEVNGVAVDAVAALRRYPTIAAALDRHDAAIRADERRRVADQIRAMADRDLTDPPIYRMEEDR